MHYHHTALSRPTAIKTDQSDRAFPVLLAHMHTQHDKNWSYSICSKFVPLGTNLLPFKERNQAMALLCLWECPPFTLCPSTHGVLLCRHQQRTVLDRTFS